MTLPAELQEELTSRIGPIEEVATVGGGCIGSTRRIVARGTRFFLKFGRDTPPGLHAVEAAGLDRLREAGSGLSIPGVVGFRDSPEGWSWIVLEWLEATAETPDHWSRLARGLAALHATRSPSWGWDRDGYIGTLRQTNAGTASWAEFWRDRRLLPQIQATRGAVAKDGEWARLLDALPDLLRPADLEGPRLLHGDLWVGNVLATRAGPALVDPACYAGHREVDLAMAELFGGFPSSFFAEYDATSPLPAGYEGRRPAYQLYYLLVHVNLFGASYIGRTARTLRSLLATM